MFCSLCSSEWYYIADGRMLTMSVIRALYRPERQRPWRLRRTLKRTRAEAEHWTREYSRESQRWAPQYHSTDRTFGTCNFERMQLLYKITYYLIIDNFKYWRNSEYYFDYYCCDFIRTFCDLELTRKL